MCRNEYYCEKKKNQFAFEELQNKNDDKTNMFWQQHLKSNPNEYRPNYIQIRRKYSQLWMHLLGDKSSFKATLKYPLSPDFISQIHCRYFAMNRKNLANSQFKHHCDVKNQRRPSKLGIDDNFLKNSIEKMNKLT